MAFEPISEEVVCIYRAFVSDGPACLFSDDLREFLRKHLKQSELIDLIEVACWIGNFHSWKNERARLLRLGFGDDVLKAAKSHESMRGPGAVREPVKKLLIRRGIHLPRGKRPDPNLETLVSRITPALMYAGIPLATGDNSKLVVILREIAEKLGVKGDPREELRRVLRLEKRLSARAIVELSEAFARGVSPDSQVN